MHLGNDQEEQNKLYQIVSDMYKNKKSEGDQMEYEDIDNELFEQYIDEFIRLGVPFALMNPNLILKDMKLGKFSFKKGDSLIIPMLFLHQLSGKWENPMKFDPKRWAPENKSKIDRNNYIPFGKGPRNCIGRELGKLTFSIMLINIIKHFKIEKDETYIPLMVQELTYSYDIEASVYLRRRGNIDTSS